MISIDWSDRTNEKVMKIPLRYDLPLKENVKNIIKWLKDYKQNSTGTNHYVIMYHATGKDTPITEKGLLAGQNNRKNFRTSESGYIYLSPNPNYAKGYGDIAFAGNSVVYEIIVPVKKLLPDKRHFFYARPDEITGSNLADSLIYGGTARVKGNIERWQIKRYEDESLFGQKKQTLMERLEEKKQEVKNHNAPVKRLQKDYERS